MRTDALVGSADVLDGGGFARVHSNLRGYTIPDSEDWMSVDVAVVGAGLSGLSAANDLAAAGLDVQVLEARDRVGGRTWTRRVGDADLDVGAQWLGPGHRRARRLAAELGVETFPTFVEGDKVLEIQGKRSTYSSDIPSVSMADLLQMQIALLALDRAARRISVDLPQQSPGANWLDARSVEDIKRTLLRTSGVRGLLDAAIRTVFGAEASELSLLHFLFYLRSGGGLMSLVEARGGAQQDRFVTGAQSLSTGLANRLGNSLKLSCPVRRIVAEGSNLRVHSDDEEVVARRVIVAVPPSLASQIDFEPRLPVDRQRLLAGTQMGATIKVLATYERAFWRDLGMSGEAVSDGAPISVVYDNTSWDGAVPGLVAFVVGEAARTLTASSPKSRRAVILDALARFFGSAARRPVDFVVQDWCAEPWTGGCPVGLPAAGVLSRSTSKLGAPTGNIHWAGTETARESNGYLEGALEAAERVVNEVLAAR